ncbi:MAG: glycosyltransferase family 4 protein [Chloroflexota bacterium]|nr:glycosyltransferase family 4 protein [Chloroflexota bacterium]
MPYPADFGGARRTYNLLEQASRAGYDIDLLAFALGDPARDAAAQATLGRLCRSVTLVADPAALPAALGAGDPVAVARKRRGQLRSLLSWRSYQFYAYYSPQMQAALDRYFAQARPDLVQVEYSQMAYYRLPAGVPALLDLHNVEYEIMGRVARAGGAPVRRIYNWAEYLKFRRAEPRLWRRFSGLLVTSARDGALVQGDWPAARVTVVPNGVDTTFFHPPAGADAADAAGDPQIVFTGMMAYYPNHDGARYFAEAIWPTVRAAVPGVGWSIVGAEPPPAVRALAVPGSGITVTGRVTDVRPAIWRSRASVVPLRMGGGTRLKIVEALAMGQPVISTTVGCEGIPVTSGHELLLADTPAAFAAAVIGVLRDPAQAAALGTAGRALAVSTYSWPVVAQPLLAAWARAAT